MRAETRNQRESCFTGRESGPAGGIRTRGAVSCNYRCVCALLCSALRCAILRCAAQRLPLETNCTELSCTAPLLERSVQRNAPRVRFASLSFSN